MNISRCQRILRLTYILKENQNVYYDIKLRYYAKVLASREAMYKRQRVVKDEGINQFKREKNIKQCEDIKLINDQIYLEDSSLFNLYDYYDINITDNFSSEFNNVYSNLYRQNDFLLKNKIVEGNENNIMFLPSDIFDSSKFIKNVDKVIPQPLDKCMENLSDFGPGLSPTFNFAVYAEKSDLIKTFIKLGVKLYKLEKNQNYMRALLTVDLKNELPLYLQFFHDYGVPSNILGEIITMNPMILKEDLGDMKTRIMYLKAHDFTQESIARIITKNPSWLMWTTTCIDERLGHFQNEFRLSGPQVRYLATKQPKLITYSMKVIHENTFAIREEMGFSKEETRVLLLKKPNILKMSRHKIIESFTYLQDVMKLSNYIIIANANILTIRVERLKSRHEYLLQLGKVQYDPQKPGYISPMDVVFGSDNKFCCEIAKTSIGSYYLFLKTL